MSVIKPIIFLNFSMFDKTQHIYLVSEEGVQVVGMSNLDKLDETISDLCAARRVSTVRLAGDKTFLNTLSTNIKTHHSLKYNNNELEIIVEGD